MQKTLVVFAPHPDDETLACGGTMVINTELGNAVHIVFMTDGRYSHRHTLGIETYPTPEDVKSIRREEAGKVARILGVKGANLTFLEYEDGTLGSHIEAAAEKVQGILKTIKPDLIYFPARFDRHRDHKATNIIVKHSIRILVPQPELFQYVIWKSGANPTLRPVSVDIARVLSIKKLAINEYKSQVTLISEKQARPILIKRFLNRFLVENEVFFTDR
jgi:LmbE family N-acetylglucosaminyl deacetylase